MNLKHKIKIFFVLIFIFAFCHYYTFSFGKDNDTLKIAYITDLNLYPTPVINKAEKSYKESRAGLLIYESQSIFQEIVKCLNQKLNPDVVVFGGNNISPPDWQLFFDMISEIKASICFVVGSNEIKLYKYNDFLKSLKVYELDSNHTWWAKTIDNYLLIGLNSFYLFSGDINLSKEQSKWLKAILSANKDKATVVFLHEPVIDHNGMFVDNKNITQLLEIIRLHPQVKLVVSGNENINRKFIVGGTVYVLASSPIAYPCTFKYIEISDSSIRFEAINIPLKGIVKKAEQSLIYSQWAKTLFPGSIKSIKKHVLGQKTDNDFVVVF